MNLNEKDAFVQSMIKDLQHEVTKRIPKMPEEWDGYELRQFVLDFFKQHYAYMPMERKRKKDYENTVIVDNLI